MRKASDVQIREYLYIDNPRLSIYAEQVAGPVKRDKIPEWNARLSLTGPSAGASQKVESRPHSVTEKIELLTEYLRKNDSMVEGADAFVKKFYSGRNWSPMLEDGPVFVMDKLLAAKVRVPGLPGTPSQAQSITMWISAAPKTPHTSNRHEWMPNQGMICLLEDYRGADGKLFDGSGYSAYTILESLLFALADQIDETVLGKHFQRQMGAQSSFAIKSHEDAWWRTSDEQMAAFAKGPFTMLRKMGCTVSRPRRITSLFRVRDIGPEIGDGTTISIFGYPIFVYAG